MKPLPRSLPTLQTERLRLRALAAGDVAALFAIYGDPEVMRFASDDVFPEAASVLTMLASVERLLLDGTSLEWGIESRDTATLIGTCGLHSFDADSATAEVGCMLARCAWGRGCMREALIAMFEHARQSSGLLRLRADIDALNLRSIRLFEALGFVHVGAGIYERA